MQVQLLLQIAGVGVLTTVIHQVLTRAGREDMATLSAVAGLALVLTLVVTMVSDLFKSVQSLFQLY